MKTSLNTGRSNTFIKNVSVLMSGTAIAQGLLIAAGPILSRLYTPDAFGVFALYTSVVAIIAVISTWRYELAIVLPKGDKDAVNLLILSSCIVLGMSLISLLFVVFFGKWLSVKLGTPELNSWLLWVPFSVFIMGLYQAFNYWSTRRKSFKRLAISQMLKTIGVVSTQTSANVIGAGGAGLIGGQVIGQTIATTILGAQIWRDDRGVIKKYLDFNRLRFLAKEHKDFLKFNSPQAFLNALSQNMTPFILAYYFGSEIVGIYALAFRFLQLPINLISETVRRVYYQRITEIFNIGGDVYHSLKKTTLALIVVGILPTLIIVISGPEIFAFILGSRWHLAGVYSQWLIIGMFFNFVNPPAVVLTQVYNVQKQFFYQGALQFVFRAIALILGGLFWGSIESIALYSITGACFNAYLIFWVFSLVKSKAVSSENKVQQSNS